MVSLSAEDRLLSEEARLRASLEAFWEDFVRRPSKSRTPGRQFIQGPLDDHPDVLALRHHQRAVRMVSRLTS